MTKAELIAALQAACIKVYGDPVQEPDDPTLYSVKTDQANGLGSIRGGVTVSFKVLDEGTADEAAYKLHGWPNLPKDKNEKGMAYLAGKVAGGDIIGFEMTKTRADLGPFSFFIVTVWEPAGEGTVTEKQWRVAEDGNGDAYHAVIV